jgi:hypothetical protein
VLLVLLAEPSWDTPSLHPEIPENLEGTTSKGLWIVCSHQSEYGISWRSEEKILYELKHRNSLVLVLVLHTLRDDSL